MYPHMLVDTYAHTGAHIYIHVHIYIYYVAIYIYICICTSLVCVCICVYVCMHPCIFSLSILHEGFPHGGSPLGGVRQGGWRGTPLGLTTEGRPHLHTYICCLYILAHTY